MTSTFLQRSAAWLALLACIGLSASLLVLAAPDSASAHQAMPLHAKLTGADPGIGAVLKSAPTTVTLQFLEDVVPPPTSEIKVYDDKGNLVSGTTSFSSSNPKTLSVPLQAGDSETYVVFFHTVSADDQDPYTDAYQFTVNKDAAPSAGQQPDSSGDSISSTPHGTSSSGSSGVSPLLTALIGLIALIVGAAGGFSFARNRRPA